MKTLFSLNLVLKRQLKIISENLAIILPCICHRDIKREFCFQARELNSHVIPTPFATTEVTVMVTDLNDETPTFRSKHYKCEIAENSPLNTPITFLGDSLPEVFDYDQVR